MRVNTKQNWTCFTILDLTVDTLSIVWSLFALSELLSLAHMCISKKFNEALYIGIECTNNLGDYITTCKFMPMTLKCNITNLNYINWGCELNTLLRAKGEFYYNIKKFFAQNTKLKTVFIPSEHCNCLRFNSTRKLTIRLNTGSIAQLRNATKLQILTLHSTNSSQIKHYESILVILLPAVLALHTIHVKNIWKKLSTIRVVLPNVTTFVCEHLVTQIDDLLIVLPNLNTLSCNWPLRNNALQGQPLHTLNTLIVTDVFNDKTLVFKKLPNLRSLTYHIPPMAYINAGYFERKIIIQTFLRIMEIRIQNVFKMQHQNKPDIRITGETWFPLDTIQ